MARRVRKNPTPMEDEFEAWVESVKRRYGRDPMKAMAIDPAAYKEHLGEKILELTSSRTLSQMAGKFGVHLNDMLDANVWNLSAEMRMIDPKNIGYFDETTAVIAEPVGTGFAGLPGPYMQEYNVILLTVNDKEKLGKLGLRVWRAVHENPYFEGISEQALTGFLMATVPGWSVVEDSMFGDSASVNVDIADDIPSGLMRMFRGYYIRARGGGLPGIEDALWVPWDWPSTMYWTLSTTKNRLKKAAKEKAKLVEVSYDADLAAGDMVYDWPSDPVGERWWVMRIPDAGALGFDGTVMGHCTRNDDYGHQSDLESGEALFYSLRREVDGIGKREVTMKVQSAERHYQKYAIRAELTGGAALEARGQNNSIPGWPQFHDPDSVLAEAAKLTADGAEATRRLIAFCHDMRIGLPPELRPALLVLAGRVNRGLSDNWRLNEETIYAVARGRHGQKRKNPGPDRQTQLEVAEMLRDMLSVPAFTET